MDSPEVLLQDVVTERGVVVDGDTRTAIVSSFWPPATSIDATEPLLLPTHDLNTYFDYYARQCQVFFSHRGTLIAARTHQDLADLILGFLHDLDRHEIRALLAKRLQIEDDSSSTSSSSSSPKLDPAVLDRTIDLAARLFVMMKLGEVPHSIAHSRALKWTQGTLGQFVRQQFDVPPVLSCAGVKLPKLFNARNLVRIGGIKIEWTANLADHLRMIDDDEKVAVFCYPSFLMMHQNSGIFPEGFIQETLWTLKLLFPATDKGMRRWVNAQQQPEMDGLVAACGNLRAELRHIEKFRYWRDRLVVLKEVFDEAEPSSLSQWWYDRRKKVQWYTWWLAVLVLLLGASFGVAQSIEGALQVYKAFNP